MIFKPELVRKIKEGRKTMTRRPVHGEEDCRYRPGRVYTVQPGRGKAGVMQITILDVRQELVDEITLRDALREGFRTTSDFKEYWAGLYGTYQPDTPVWVLTFAAGDVTDRPRLLAARSGGPGGDYTTIPARAMREEGEAVPLVDQERYSREGREKPVAEWEAQRARLLSVIREIRQHASNPLAEQNLRGIERQVAALDRKMQSAA